MRPARAPQQSLRLILHSLAATALFLVPGLRAQVPHLITYQGVVAANGVAFSGTGHFKFALVSSRGTNFYWRNDGNNTTPGEPAVSVAVGVTNGLFTVILGDTSFAGMAAIPPGVFSNSEVYLRLWFNDGVNGFAWLSPDQRISAVGYALVANMALTVPDGTITAGKLASNAVTAVSIAPGSVTAAALAPGSAVSNLAASGQIGVAGSGIILSDLSNATGLINIGYVRIGQADLASVEWKRGNTNAPITAKTAQTAVWTGSEMIVWGGGPPHSRTGARYNPVSDSWSPMTLSNAPSARSSHTAVWTESEMLVWGGYDGFGPLNTGARYDPATDTWVAISTNGAPSPRSFHTAIWTGTEMIVWGGAVVGPIYFNTGGRYDPLTDSWLSTKISNAPAGRSEHTAIWTGNEMIVWGGIDQRSNPATLFATGGRYDPVADSWKATITNGTPSARHHHTAVWTGSEMIVWGGSGSGVVDLDTGASYSVNSDTWNATPTDGAPTARSFHTAVWTGHEMIVWGGRNNLTNILSTGGRLNHPMPDCWTPTPLLRSPEARLAHSAAWSGSSMIVSGGQGRTAYLNSVHTYTPTRVVFLYLKP